MLQVIGKYGSDPTTSMGRVVQGVLIQTEQKPVDKDNINVLVLVDDSDSKKMSKYELKDKLTAIMGNIAQEIDNVGLTYTGNSYQA